VPTVRDSAGRAAELETLLHTARQLTKLGQESAALVAEARERLADATVMAAARQMHSTLLRTKHETEDLLVSFVLELFTLRSARPLGSWRRVRARPLGARGARAGRSRAAIARLSERPRRPFVPLGSNVGRRGRNEAEPGKVRGATP
jgi:hypothetical protein